VLPLRGPQAVGLGLGLGLGLVVGRNLEAAFAKVLAARTIVVVDVRIGNYPTPTERFDAQITEA
jgi:hypothetical protein